MRLISEYYCRRFSSLGFGGPCGFPGSSIIRTRQQHPAAASAAPAETKRWKDDWGNGEKEEAERSSRMGGAGVARKERSSRIGEVAGKGRGTGGQLRRDPYRSDGRAQQSGTAASPHVQQPPATSLLAKAPSSPPLPVVRERDSDKGTFFHGGSFKSCGASSEVIAALAALGISRPSHVQVG